MEMPLWPPCGDRIGSRKAEQWTLKPDFPGVSSEREKAWDWGRQTVLSRHLASLVGERSVETPEIGHIEYRLRRGFSWWERCLGWEQAQMPVGGILLRGLETES